MTESGPDYRITDLHSHVMPGVDDGARDLDEALAALRTLAADGIVRVVATPHFRASLLERPSREAEKLIRFDAAYARLREAAAAEGLEIGIERGCEFKLDAPVVDLSDTRLRLAGTRYALVEFGSFQLPPFAGNQLAAVHEAGWLPVLAHPERYAGVTGAWDRVEEWVREGTLLQVNARSLLGWYGAEPQIAACELLRLGWVSCLASDYHSRGTPDFTTAVRLLEQSRALPVSEPVTAPGAPGADAVASEPAEMGSQAVRSAIAALVSENPEHILADRAPTPVCGLEVPDFPRKKPGRGWFR